MPCLQVEGGRAAACCGCLFFFLAPAPENQSSCMLGNSRYNDVPAKAAAAGGQAVPAGQDARLAIIAVQVRTAKDLARVRQCLGCLECSVCSLWQGLLSRCASGLSTECKLPCSTH